MSNGPTGSKSWDGAPGDSTPGLASGADLSGLLEHVLSETEAKLRVSCSVVQDERGGQNGKESSLGA